MYKNDLADKTKEFQTEKADLQKVIDQQREQLSKSNNGPSSSSTEEVQKMATDLEKAKKEVQESAVERERFQAQLETLVRELEQKQVGNEADFGKTSHTKLCLVR